MDPCFIELFHLPSRCHSTCGCYRPDRRYCYERTCALLPWPARTNPLRSRETISIATDDRTMQLVASWSDQYHNLPLQSNGVVEKGNEVLGDALRAPLLDRGQRDWNLVLPKLLCARLSETVQNQIICSKASSRAGSTVHQASARDEFRINVNGCIGERNCYWSKRKRDVKRRYVQDSIINYSARR